MKKVFHLVLFCLVVLITHAQGDYRTLRVTQQFQPPRLTDTPSGTIPLGSLMVRSTDNSLWVRAASQWVNISGGSGQQLSFGNGLTNTAGVVGLGGSFTGHTAVNGGGFDLSFGNGSSPLNNVNIISAGGLFVNAFQGSGANSGYFEVSPYGFQLNAFRGGIGRSLKIDTSGIVFRKNDFAPVAKIRDIPRTNEPLPALVYDTLTKELKYAYFKPLDTSTIYRNLSLKLNTADTANLSLRINSRLAGVDTVSLSNRINQKLFSSDTLSLSNRIDKKLNIADTGVFARKKLNIDIKQVNAAIPNGTDTIRVNDNLKDYQLIYGPYTYRTIISEPFIRSGNRVTVRCHTLYNLLLQVEADSLKIGTQKYRPQFYNLKVINPFRLLLGADASATIQGVPSVAPRYDYTAGYPFPIVGYDTTYFLAISNFIPGSGGYLGDSMKDYSHTVPPRGNLTDTSWVLHLGGYWGPDKQGTSSGTISGRDIYRYNDTLTADRTMNGNGKDLNLGAGTSNLDNLRSLNVYANRGWKFNDSLGGSFRSDTGKVVIQSTKGIRVSSLDSISLKAGKRIYFRVDDSPDELPEGEKPYGIYVKGAIRSDSGYALGLFSDVGVSIGSKSNIQMATGTSPVTFGMYNGRITLGSNQSNPTADLDLANLGSNALRIRYNAGAGKVLTSDASGNATWQMPGSGGGSLTVGGSNGNIQYNNGSSLAGTNNLHWDAMSSRLGVGTNTPGYTTHVNGTLGVSAAATLGSNVYVGGTAYLTGGGAVIAPGLALDDQISHKNNGCMLWKFYNIGGGNNYTSVTSRCSQEDFVFHQNGNLGLGTAVPTNPIDIVGASIRIRSSSTPAGSGDSSGQVGEIRWDNGYIYWKTASGWLRAAGSTF